MVKINLQLKNIEKKITDQQILNICISNATLSKTGKTYTDFNYDKSLLSIFSIIEDKHIDVFEIMEMQVKKI